MHAPKDMSTTIMNLDASTDVNPSTSPDVPVGSPHSLSRTSTVVVSGPIGSTDTIQGEKALTTEPKFSQTKKWGLLTLFFLGLFVDIWSWSAFFVFTRPIADDLNVPIEQQAWVITSYAVTFAAFLLFWGRVSDLYSPKKVFSYGFV